jgi:enoyl-CoA hydratase/carnithine racemase
MQPHTPEDLINATVDGSVLVITINRPAKRNAITQDMYRTINDSLSSTTNRPELGAVVITGCGESFTAGNDLADFSSGGELEESNRFLEILATIDVPLVAAVNGMAIGVGFTMLLHCDFVYVDPGAVLSAPFVSLGLVPEAASSLLLPRLIGGRRAAEMLLGGRSITGTEAGEWGLANAVTASPLAAAMEMANALASQPPLALRATKSLIRSDEQTVTGRMAEEWACFREALSRPEFADIASARDQKRRAAPDRESS